MSYQLLKTKPTLLEIIDKMRERTLNLEHFPFLEKPADYQRSRKPKTKRKKLQAASYSDEEEEDA